MRHPALHLLATRPQWLAEHAEAYVELAAVEFGDALARWQRSVLLGSLTLAALAVAATLAGVALMLWAVLPALPPNGPWLLLAVPALALALALTGLVAQRRAGRAELCPVLREQLRADLALLREVGAS